jgi:hypothetical protein
MDEEIESDQRVFPITYAAARIVVKRPVNWLVSILTVQDLQVMMWSKRKTSRNNTISGKPITITRPG